METDALCTHRQRPNWLFHNRVLQKHMAKTETPHRAPKYKHPADTAPMDPVRQWVQDHVQKHNIRFMLPASTKHASTLG